MLEFTTRLSTLALVGLSACSFAASPASTDGQPATDASAAGDAADATWTDNSLLDFSRPGTSATDATATTWNTLEPNGIIPSFWLAHAAPGTVTGFTGDETQIDWDMLPRDIPTSINNLSVLPFNNNSPLWLDAASDKFVFWGEGELLLAPGVTQFELIADDFAAVQMQAPNQLAFTNVTRARVGNGPQVGSVTNPTATATWVPIRFAMRDAGGGATFELRSRLGETGAFAPIDNDDMRINATQAPHLLALGFDDFGNTQLSGARTWQTSLANQTNSNNAPLGLGITSDSNFSIVWLGQYRVEQAGAHTFFFNTDDGHRLTIDGTIIVDKLSSSAQSSQTTVDLTAGWHDIEIDWWQSSGQNRALISVQAPDMAAPAVLAPTQLRPVVTGRNRFIAVPRNGSSNIAANSTITFDLAVSLPTDAKIVDADLRVTFTGDNGTAKLFSPSGTALADFNLNNNSTTYRHTHSDATLAADGNWKLEVSNTQNQQKAVSNIYLTVTYRSLASPAIMTTSSFRSGPKVFAQPVKVKAMSWQRQGTGAIAGFMRGCAAVCAFDAPWIAVTDGQPIVGVTGKHIEYRFDFTSDGMAVPAIDSVTVNAEGL
ncbi:MAG: hypothetical protein KBG15_07070 [Kofleriaceae bacterium]|nr:hypothetical protein [Kofleriaceae bacterium]